MFQLVLASFITLSFATAAMADARKAFHILSYVGANPTEENMVLINAGGEDGMRMGTKLNVYRDYKNEVRGKKRSLKVLTGRLEVVEVQDKISIAKILQSGSVLSQKVFHDLHMPIASDYVELEDVTIENGFALLAPNVRSFFDLFQHPKAKPLGYALTDSGEKWLESVGKNLAGRRIEMVLVEGHTDAAGSKEENRRESFLRASAVREFLISQMHLDPKRLQALGIGESQLQDSSNAAGSERRNRRIVIKAIPYDGKRAELGKPLQIKKSRF